MSLLVSRGRTLAAATAILLAAVCAGARGAEPEAALRFRRVLVPEADVDRQVRGLLPLQRREFESRLKEATRAGLPGGESETRIDDCQTEARLESGVLRGRSTLSIVCPEGRRSVLLLSPWNVALESAVWEDGAGPGAQLGNAPDGRLVCLVERSGELAVSWTVAGQTNDRGQLDFDLRWPSHTRHEMRLELPPEQTLSLQGGLLLQAPDGRSGADSTAKARWVLLGSGSQLSLRVAPAGSGPDPGPLWTKERTNYAVHRGTVEIQSTFDFEALHTPFAPLVLSLDPGMQVLEVRQSQESVPWSLLPAVADRPRLQIGALPTTIGEAPIEVTGVFPWNPRNKATLPSIQVVGGAWQDGQISVAADDALQLQVEAIAGLRQTAYTPSTAARSVDVWQFQKFLAEAKIEIVSSRGDPAIVEQSGTLLRLDATQVTAAYRGQLEFAGGPAFELEATIPRDWIVDAVEITPPDVLADRTLQARGSGPQSLRLALRRPAAEGRRLEVAVRAHRQRPPGGEPLPADLFQLVHWNDLRTARRLVAFQVLDVATQLAFDSNSDIRRLDAAALSASDLALFDAAPRAMLWQSDDASEPVKAMLAPMHPRFSANVLAHAEVDSRQVREFITVDCVPDSSPIARLRVRCSPAPPGELVWRQSGEPARDLAARRIDDPDASSGEAIYEIGLLHPRSTPFQLQTEFTRSRRAADRLMLVSVVEATSQTSQIEVRAGGDTPLAIEAEGLQAVMPGELSPTDGLPLRGVYRYEPGRAAKLSIQPARANRSLPLAWIESLDLTSSWDSEGTGQHAAVYTVYGIGQMHASFELPSGASAVRAIVDGQPEANLESSSVPGRFSLPLPAAGRRVVELIYTTHDRPLGWSAWGSFSSPIPHCDLPVLMTRWRVFTAPDIQLWSSKAVAEVAAQTGDSPALLQFAGWRQYDILPSALSEGSLRAYRPIVLQAWSWCLPLLMAAVVMRWGPGRFAWVLPVSGLIAMLTLFGPSEMVLPGVAALAGLSLGGAAALVAPRWKTTGIPNRLPIAGSAATTGITICLSLLLLFAHRQVDAQDRAARAEIDRPATWRRVVIPVDDQRQPVGDYVFLEPELYDGLVRLTEPAMLAQPDWLLGSCEYRPLFVRAEDGTVRLDEINVAIEIETFVPDATVALGFPRTQVHLIERRARLDGSIVVPEWLGDGSQLTLSVSQPGKHRLDLALGAVATIEGANSRLQIDIPRVPKSRVLFAPEDKHCVVLSAVGGESRRGDGQRTVQLGPAEQLTLAWPANVDRPSATGFEVEQLLLWKIRSGSVVAEARFLVRPLGGRIRELAIELDPRLRPLPQVAGQAVVRQWIEKGEVANILHLEFGEPVDSESRVTANLFWGDATGVGSFVLPLVSVPSGVTRRAWTALNLSGNLQWRKRPAFRPTDPSPEEFARAWGEPLPGESAVVDGASAGLRIDTEPAQARIVARQVVDCSVSTASARVHTTLDLSGLPGHALQHRLQTTPGLKVTEVKVLEGNQPVRVRWSQDSQGVVHVLHLLPPASEQRWEVSGYAPITAGQSPAGAPLLKYVGAAEGLLTLHVYRRSNARVSAHADPAQWVPVPEASIGEYAEGLGRLAGSWQSDYRSKHAAPTLTVSANVLDPAGYMLTRLVPSESQWEVAIDVHVESRSAALDRLRLEIPAAIAGPLTVVPAMPQHLLKPPGQAAQIVEMVPQQAIEGQSHFKIMGSLRESDPDAIVLPVVALLDAPRVRRFAALPTRWNSGSLEWQSSGLQAVSLEDADLTGAVVPPGYELFEMTSAQVVASAQAQSATAVAPLVRLADHRLVLRSASQLVGSSTLDILPRGAQQFEFQVPWGTRLVQLSNEGLPVNPIYLGANRWRVPASSDRLPQRIEIIYTSALPSSGDSFEFRPPAMATRPVRSLWAVSRAFHSLSEVGAMPAQQIARIEAMADILEQMAVMLEQDPRSPDSAANFLTWSQRLQQVQGRVALSRLSPELSQRYRAAMARVETAGEELGMAETFASSQPPSTPPPSDEGPLDIRFDVTDGGQSIRIRDYRSTLHSPPRANDARWIWACCILGVTCVLSLSRIRSALGRSAPGIVGLGGVVWLALGSAPWIGWSLVAIAVWLSIRWPWPRSNSPSLSNLIRRPA